MSSVHIVSQVITMFIKRSRFTKAAASTFVFCGHRCENNHYVYTIVTIVLYCNYNYIYTHDFIVMKYSRAITFSRDWFICLNLDLFKHIHIMNVRTNWNREMYLTTMYVRFIMKLFRLWFYANIILKHTSIYV